MSDPVTNVEIEDVLSSIRRLVADDARPKAAPEAARGKPERLLLTPAQRVPDDLPKPAEPRSRPASRPAAEVPASQPQASASSDSAAFPFRPHREGRPALERRESLTPASDASDAGKTGPAAAARRLTLGLAASDDEFEEIYDDTGDAPSFDASTLLGKLVEEELARALASPATEPTSEPASEPAQTAATEPEPAEPETDALLSRIAEIAAPEQQAAPRGQAHEAFDDGIPTADVPLPEPELPEMVLPEPEASPEVEPDGGLAGKIAALEAMIARHKGLDSPVADEAVAPEPAAEITLEPSAGLPEEPASSEEPPRAAFVHRPQRPLEWQDHVVEEPQDIAPEQPEWAQAAAFEEVAPEGKPEALVLEGPVWKGAPRSEIPDMPGLPDVAAAESSDALPAPVELFDEDMLRELVSELIRQELQGALGERITRNVRKMVRREIHRMVTSEHFD